jgi:hypothetical protein
MESNDWFDEISLSYAKNIREIEAANAHFDQQSESMLLHLVETVQVQSRQQKLKVVGESGGVGKTGPWKNVWIAGDFASATGIARASSIACGFRHGDFWGDNATDAEFGFVSYLTFTLAKSDCAAMNALALAKSDCPDATEVHWANGGFYLAYGQSSPENDKFSLVGLRDVMAKLVASFSAVDTWMAENYKSRVLAKTLIG